MISDPITLGKINLNLTQHGILKLLFHAIYTHSGYDVPGTQDTVAPYLDSQVTQKNTGILDTAVEDYTTNTKQFDTRAEVVNNTTMFSDNTLDAPNFQQTDDATQEEIIGMFVNLTKADQIITAQLYIIAVAQTIQDVRGVTINKYLDNNGEIGTANESAIEIDINGDEDINDSINETITNTQIGMDDQYSDQITSTQKLLIIIYKTPTSKYIIRRLEYIID